MESFQDCQHHTHGINCQHLAPVSVSQNLFEMDFDRGIWRAALDGEIDRLETLLSKNSNRIPVDLRDSTGFTALHYAVRKGDKFLDCSKEPEVVQLLLSYGAEIDAQTTNTKATALHRASLCNQPKTVGFLLLKGANISLQTSDGSTCLHKSVEANAFETTTTLLSFLKKKGDREGETLNSFLEIKDNRGRTALDLTTNEQMKALLLSFKPTTNTSD